MENVNGFGALSAGELTLGRIEYTLTVESRPREARPPFLSIRGSLRSCGWPVADVPSSDLVLTLADDRTFLVRRQGGYNRRENTCLVQGRASD
jgi:hypothetical protein